MTLKELVLRARSYRRFDAGRPVPMRTLLDAVDIARLVPSGANLQPLRYVVSTSPEINARIFPHLRWARNLKDWNGPTEGERPAAYVVIGGDSARPRNHHVDMGIAAQTLLLHLAEQGIAGCMLGNVDFEAVREVVSFPPEYELLLVLAVGYPGETIVLEDLPPGGPTPYWRDRDGVHHVPKRGLDEVLIGRFE